MQGAGRRIQALQTRDALTLTYTLSHSHAHSQITESAHNDTRHTTQPEPKHQAESRLTRLRLRLRLSAQRLGGRPRWCGGFRPGRLLAAGCPGRTTDGRMAYATGAHTPAHIGTYTTTSPQPAHEPRATHHSAPGALALCALPESHNHKNVECRMPECCTCPSSFPPTSSPQSRSLTHRCIYALYTAHKAAERLSAELPPRRRRGCR